MKYKKFTSLLVAGAAAASMMLGGCGSRISSTEVGATIGGQDISLGYMNFMAHYTQMNYDTIFASYYGDDYWTSEDYADDDGNTMEASVKDSVLDDIEQDYLMEAHMEDYGVVVDDDTLADIQAAAEQFMSDNTDKAIKSMGATQEYVEDMLYYRTVASLMEDAIKGEVGDDLDIADYARRTFSYVEIDMEGYTDEDGNYVEYNDTQKGNLGTQASLLADKAADDFDGTMDEYDYTVESYSYGEDEEDFDEAVIAVADTLSEGEVSGAIEGDDAWYIIRLDSENDEDAAESAMEDAASDMKSDHYDEVLEGYQDESDFTVDEDAWAKVHFTEIYEIDYGTDDDEE
ncbi:MAG: peptidyl-prolyl cis-trans isomerase [Clostridiales bacterium]|nr:peptidyl-prolyl cis-trans isomerase [Clostridiales bacterium]